MSDARFQCLFDISLDAIVIVNDAGHFTSANPAACALLGYSSAQLQQMRISDLVMPMGVRAARQYTAYLRAGKAQGELHFVRSDGEVRTASYMALRLAPGEHLITLREITADRQAAAEKQELLEQVQSGQERLQIALQRTANIVDSISDVFFALDAEWRFVSVNPAAERYWGISRQDLLGRNLYEVFPKILETQLYREFTEAMAGRCARHFDTFSPIAATWVAVDVYPAIEGLLVFWRDLTERKRAERLLHESEERLTLAMQAAEIGTWDYNPITGDLRWDDRCKELFGLPPDAEVDYDTFLAGLHPEDREWAHQVVLRALDPAGKGECDIEYRTVGLQNGMQRWCRATGRVVFGIVGDEVHAVRFIGTILDITPRKQLETQLRQETETLEAINRLGRMLSAELDLEKLVQAATDAATQLIGAQFGAFFYNVVNASGESYRLFTLSGVSREAFSRFPVPRNTAMFAPTFSGEAVVRVDDVTKDPRYGRSAPYHGMPSGHLSVVSYLAVPVVSRSGAVLGALLFGHSQPGRFTDRHERIVVGLAAQAAIAIDNAQLFQAERERSEQLAMAISEVHHRVKNSLQSVGALLEMQIPFEGDSVPIEAVHDSLSQIKTIAIVHDLLARDKPIGSVDAAHVLTNLSRLLASGMSAGRQQMHIVVDAEPVEMSTKTATALALAVNELLTNAAKHQAVREEKDVSTCHDADTITVTMRRSGSHILVSVQDAGPGFPADFDSELHANIGLQLVQTLVGHDLHGAIRFSNATLSAVPDTVLGGYVEITFPASACGEG